MDQVRADAENGVNADGEAIYPFMTVLVSPAEKE